MCRCIVDFYAAALKLVVEIDGGFHHGRLAEDAAGEAELVRLYGVHFVRFDASLVEHEMRATHRSSLARSRDERAVPQSVGAFAPGV